MSVVVAASTFIVELAALSGAVIRPFFGRHDDLRLELKADDTPVTAADRQAEAALRRRIQQRFPDHGVIGEEYGADRPDAEWVWILDPIDGTKAFATACPLFGTLIGLLHQGRPVLGAIHQPILGQLLVGDGAVTTLNQEPVRVRAPRPLAEATLLTSDWMTPARHRDGAAFDRLARSVRLARTWGDCYAYLLLATGWADVVVDPVMNPWDLLPLVPVVQGAGGTLTTWSGGDAAARGADSAVATTDPTLQAAVLDLLGSR